MTTDEVTRKFLWETMVTYTLLINTLFKEVAEHNQFQEWQAKGFIPREPLGKMIEDFEKCPNSQKLPARFYDSATRMTQYVYKSWFSVQKQRHSRMLGKKRWLGIVQQDYDLEQATSFTLEEIFAKAQAILEGLSPPSETQGDSRRKRKSTKSSKSLIGELLDQFEMTTDTLHQRAIIHLLKNDLKVSEKPDDPEELKQRLDSKQIEIDRLEGELQSRFPKGRDPTGERFAAVLLDAISLPPEDNPDSIATTINEWREQKQISFLNPLPYPILWGSADEFIWSTEPRSNSTSSESLESSSKKRKSKKKKCVSDRICLQFKRLGNFIFKIQCDRRQLPIFHQLVADYQAYAASPEEQCFNQTVFALRSAQLIWQPDTKKSKKQQKLDQSKSLTSNQPWITHRLYLHCAIDTGRLTAEGIEAVIQETRCKIIEELDGRDKLTDQEVEQLPLTKGQKSRLKSLRTQLTRLDNPYPPRPSKPNYKGDPLITVGVSLSRQMPLTACVIDLRTGNVVERQTSKHLLTIHGIKVKRGKRSILQLRLEHWRLVNKLHLRRQRNLLQRQKEQKQEQYREGNNESNLGSHVERLLANRLVRLAVKWNAGSIAVPDLKYIREIIESDIQARGKLKFPQQKELQEQYAKQLRASFHRWSYHRLVEFIRERASSAGIQVVAGKQTNQGSPMQKAVEVATSAHKLSALQA
ncbi:hypothetical protein H6F80_27845 [Leptolyngbya sp. FACHB-711]|nr:hypothetical protein [Leptolyngbya sp. FACHB-711]